VQGPSGFQGRQGIPGATGPQGFQGRPGFQGAQGTQGPQGRQGAQGPTGFTGRQGIPGATGPQGFQGRPGFQGAQGAQGPQGRQGVAGSVSQVAALGINTAADTSLTGTIRAQNDVISNFSDARLKNITSVIHNAIEKVEQIRGVYYRSNDTAKQLGFGSEKQQVGLIAQEVQKVLPEVVVPAPFDIDPNEKSLTGKNYLTIMYSRIVPLLIQALKEQKSQIDELKKFL
jgi:hypothetical protein